MKITVVAIYIILVFFFVWKAITYLDPVRFVVNNHKADRIEIRQLELGAKRRP